jgi:tetratricopeptide (TPR) repeat protein
MIPSSLPEGQKALFDRAVARFRVEGPVCVNPEKLSAYLDHTRDIEAPAAQRLRWLAIGLEHDRFERGWDGLRAIYQAAAQADPTDPFILHSWGLSASIWAENPLFTPDPSERMAITGEADRVLRAALERAPRDSLIAHTLGLVHYNDPAGAEGPDGFLSRAIDWFARAVEWDPGNQMARLYLAHCFHDRKDWARAIAEYEKIDLQQLARRWPAWRAVKCREQLAHCHACAGNTDEAVRRFTAFLDDVESWDGARIKEDLINVDELVDAVTHRLDHPPLLWRTRELVKRLELAKLYPQLFSS